ncbi:hypothetical protein L3Q82_023425 [Scortum barcoo]|uniref:Uncharacterized protein n=1 Tax=Scortum barcoo TaxID=214431 RepID=A0ACB8WYB7_9TELE|nr:hypothetical protein L3Q82_023425 [Scortum barcoo]
MDPAGLDSVKMALSAQDQKIQLHEIQLTNISGSFKPLMDSHAELKMGVYSQVRHLAVQLRQIINQLEELTQLTASRARARGLAGHSKEDHVSRSAVRIILSRSTCSTRKILQRFQRKWLSFCLTCREGRQLGQLRSGQEETCKDVKTGGGLCLVDLANRIDVRLEERELERRRSHHRPVDSGSSVQRPFQGREGQSATHTGGTRDCGRLGAGEKGAFIGAPELLCLPGLPEADPREYPDLTRVPPCYHDLQEVFNKTKATSLPPHRPWDCAINLLPGAPIPKARLYSISGPERKAMEEYIEASLRSGIILPSSSPAGAGFFFVGKKDSSLRPYASTTHHVCQVLLRLLENQLYIKAEKCEFHASSVSFLGFIISWKSGEDGPRKERNYDVGNRELLAIIKVALEEWRHWLEGAEQPFLTLYRTEDHSFLPPSGRSFCQLLSATVSLSSGYHPGIERPDRAAKSGVRDLFEMSGGTEPILIERPYVGLRVHPTFHVSKLKPVQESPSSTNGGGEAGFQMPKPSQLTPLNVKEQRLYSELLPSDLSFSPYL